MTARDEEPIDGGLEIDPAIARVLLRYHEAVAQAAQEAHRDLQRLGLTSGDATAYILGRRPNVPSGSR